MTRFLNDVNVDENGLSADSLRGSTQHIAVHLVGGEQRDPNNTNNILTRGPLSLAERESLRQMGTFVDENGNGIDDRDEVLGLAPPGFFIPNMTTAPLATGQPTGYWGQRGGEWVWFGERPPSSAATPSAGQGGGHLVDQDPARAFEAYRAQQTVQSSPPPPPDIAEHVARNTKPLLPPADAYAPPELLASAPEPGVPDPPPPYSGRPDPTPPSDSPAPPPPAPAGKDADHDD